MKKLTLKNIIFIINFLLTIFFIQFVNASNIEPTNQGLYGREKLEYYIQKSKSFIGESSNDVRHNAVLAFNIASADHDTVYLALACSYIGASYVMDDQLDTAIVLLKKAEEYALKSNENEPLIRVYNNLGTIYELNKNINKAYKYYAKANSIIQDNQLTKYYKPRLSLAAIYCKRNKGDKAIALLTKIIEDSRNNSDLYFELLARLNLLEVKIYSGKYNLNEMNEAFQYIADLLTKNEVKGLQNRFLELKALVGIENGQLDKAYSLIEQLPHLSIDDKKTKSVLIGKIKKASIKRANIKQVRIYDSIQSQINKEILDDYEYQVSLNNNSLYELSNQNLILDQIKADRNELERKISLYKTLLNVSIIVLIVLLISVFILIFRYEIIGRKKSHSPKYESDISPSKTDTDNIFKTFEFCPIFRLDANFTYQEANTLFYQLSGKKTKESLRGSNDFDLPWLNQSAKLIKIYQEVKKDLQSKYIIEDLFNCKSEILLLPLIKDEQFTGVLGMLIPVNKKEKSEMAGRMDKNEKIDDLQPRTTILLVDDEVDNVILIKRLLKKYSCDLTTANSGAQALDILKEAHFDYILMDLEMPNMSGYETVTKITDAQRNKMKIFALTAHSKNEIPEKDIKLFDDILTKPISRDMLVSKLYLSLKTPEN